MNPTRQHLTFIFMNNIAHSQGLHRGYGIFETIQISNSIPLFIEKHIKRLSHAASVVSLTFDPITLFDQIHTFIQENNLQSAALKVLLFKNQNDDEILITSRPIPYQPAEYQQGHSLHTSSIYRSVSPPLCAIKSTNYLNYVLAKQEADEAGFTDSLLLNHKEEICETTRANIFFVKDNVLHTPHLECGLLPGTMRDTVLKLSKELNIEIQQDHYLLKGIKQADEAFLTNSLMGIMPVAKIANQHFNIQNFPVTKALSKALAQEIKNYEQKNLKPPIATGFFK